jgi:hypothetical protein
MRISCLLALALAVPVFGQGMNADPEAQAPLARFQAMAVVGPALADDFDKQAERRTTGPVTLAPGHDDQGAIWPETRDEAVNTHYGVVLPPRGHLALDLMRPATRPADHNFMTLASAGTPGNTKLALRILGDMRP